MMSLLQHDLCGSLCDVDLNACLCQAKVLKITFNGGKKWKKPQEEPHRMRPCLSVLKSISDAFAPPLPTNSFEMKSA